MQWCAFLSIALANLLVSCATYRQELNRGQRLYDSNEYERALALFRVLEADTDSLSLAARLASREKRHSDEGRRRSRNMPNGAANNPAPLGKGG